MVGMETTTVLERVGRIGAVRANGAAGRCERESALVEVRRVRAWLDASEADLVRGLAAEVSFPEQSIAESSKGSLSQASSVMDRAATLESTPAIAAALDRGAVTAGHVDAITRAGKTLDPSQREELLDRVDALVDVAEHASQAEFARRVRDEARRLQAADGMDALQRQRRATSLRTWADVEGMWNLKARFDPLTGVALDARLTETLQALFATSTPDTCPTDPGAKQDHLRALALADMILTGGSPKPGRPEYVVVIDADTPAATGPQVEFSIPVEVPWRVLAELADDADVHTVVVRNGVVLHAPGNLDLGRSTRLANRAQRRALRGLYATCAIPGCTTHYDRCKLHHVIWWRHGGRTDLDNLLPVCVRHHHKIHDSGWEVTLGPNRQLTIRFPDGTVQSTGPPGRSAA
jgi:Domain of unknown function (DUF222)